MTSGVGASVRTRPSGVAGARASAARSTLLLGALGLAATLCLWQLVSVNNLIDRTTFPPPTEVFRALVDTVQVGWFWSALGQTAKSAALGMLISMVVALPLGALVGLNKFAFNSTRWVWEFLRPIPVIALLPLALLLYGTTLQMKLVLIIYGTMLPMLIQVVYGVQNVDAVASETARAYRLPRALRLWLLVLPSAAPFIATGFRVSGVTALLLSVTTELVGGAPGIGFQIARAQNAAHFATLYALVVVAGLLGIAVNSGLAALERRALRWLPQHREQAR